MTTPKKKTDKMIVAEIFIGESLKSFLKREYQDKSITELTKLLNQKAGTNIERTTVWEWLKFYNIRRKQWKV